MFTDEKRYQLQPAEANYIHLNAGVRLIIIQKIHKAPSLWLKALAPVNTAPCDGKTENL